MSLPVISDCYNELMADPSLLQSFAEDEWLSIHGFPDLYTLCCCVVLESLFTQLTSPVPWGKAGANYITNAGRRAMSTEIAPLAIWIMYGVGKEKLGMLTTFCRSDQTKVEPLVAPLTISQ